ncbi:ABC transporter permease [Streptomyces iconiensis]|uniref:ABC transporter permease n=1 Tax=Streptomyces iconiensis TaxID=1384038 RepID=A0ABT7A809_9ACTN|nr:ABC transporter permease [Streptomyces iconiensis]MDJ1137479.1 ABC transporter permease [Streptomyces iconiensis]
MSAGTRGPGRRCSRPGPGGQGRSRPAVLLAAAFLTLVVLFALFPALFTSGDPADTDPVHAFAPPSAQHFFGTDQLGRDVLTRSVHGTRYSLAIGAAATAIAMVTATVWGLAAALLGRFADAVLMRVADVFLALPGLLLALMVILVMDKGALSTTAAVAAGTAPGLARVVRAQALVVRLSGYVESAIALGVRTPLTVLRHILPNALSPLLVLAPVSLGTSISAGAALSYLGLGLQPPTPEWGTMLTESQAYLQQGWWTALFPGLLLVATVLAVTAVGGHVGGHARGRVLS